MPSLEHAAPLQPRASPRSMRAWAVAALDLVFPALCPVCEARLGPGPSRSRSAARAGPPSRASPPWCCDRCGCAVSPAAVPFAAVRPVRAARPIHRCATRRARLPRTPARSARPSTALKFEGRRPARPAAGRARSRAVRAACSPTACPCPGAGAAGAGPRARARLQPGGAARRARRRRARRARARRAGSPGCAHTAAQSDLPRRERRANVRGAFAADLGGGRPPRRRGRRRADDRRHRRRVRAGPARRWAPPAWACSQLPVYSNPPYTLTDRDSLAGDLLAHKEPFHEYSSRCQRIRAHRSRVLPHRAGGAGHRGRRRQRSRRRQDPRPSAEARLRPRQRCRRR